MRRPYYALNCCSPADTSSANELVDADSQKHFRPSRRAERSRLVNGIDAQGTCGARESLNNHSREPNSHKYMFELLFVSS